MAWGAGNELWVVNTPVLVPLHARRFGQLRAEMASAVCLGARAHRPLPPQTAWAWSTAAHATSRRWARRTSRWAGERTRPRAASLMDVASGRGDHPRVVDAPLAAIGTPGGSGSASRARGRSATSTRTPASTSRSPEVPGFTRGVDFAGNLAFVGTFAECARAPSSAAFRSPSGWQRTSGPAAVCVIDLTSGQVVALLRFEPDRRAGGVRRDGRRAAGRRFPGTDQRRREIAGELIRGTGRGAGRCVSGGAGDGRTEPSRGTAGAGGNGSVPRGAFAMA